MKRAINLKGKISSIFLITFIRDSEKDIYEDEFEKMKELIGSLRDEINVIFYFNIIYSIIVQR